MHKITEWIWRIRINWRIVLKLGEEVIELQSHEGEGELACGDKDAPYESSSTLASFEMVCNPLLEAPEPIDRERAITPRRNASVEQALQFVRLWADWSSRVERELLHARHTSECETIDTSCVTSGDMLTGNVPLVMDAADELLLDTNSVRRAHVASLQRTREKLQSVYEPNEGEKTKRLGTLFFIAAPLTISLQASSFLLQRDTLWLSASMLSSLPMLSVR